ncbi:tripartite tricarboxylate transporter TctB family protein [uncultured Jannaschia sp.]|uniref:tripartite tricarboxylate transporter TctB family protein n=1 Tax=uncultured Jannaschia sp. TaxID=293347 RepID=UPI00260E7B47|nr:tripartite tricarboxylate transporter TctB family protein [uncultured Jannaschia sp.]
MKLNDSALGLILIVAAIAIRWSATGFSRLPNQAYGSETMPIALSALALGLGAYMVGQGVVARDGLPRARMAEWARAPSAVARVALALALVAGYVLLAGRLGFVPVSVAILLVLMLATRVRWWVAIPVAAFATLVIQQAFGRLLLVPLPRSDALGFLW